ncbi:MerR family transcriptional regulator, partial [Streptomyces mirabilis]
MPYGTKAPPRVPQRGAMTADDSFGRLDDDDYPAYTMG